MNSPPSVSYISLSSVRREIRHCVGCFDRGESVNGFDPMFSYAMSRG